MTSTRRQGLTAVLLLLPLTGAALRADEAEERAVQVIEKLGGKIVRDPNSEGRPPVIEVDLHRSNVTDADLKLFKGLKQLKRLNLYDTTVTDAGLKELISLADLQLLFLDKTKITDSGLKELKDLPRLKELGLDNTTVTDVGLEELKEVKSLRVLHLHGTEVTKTGVAGLQRALPELKIDR